WRDRQIIDVKLVENPPERAEPDHTAGRIFRSVHKRYPFVAELSEVHVARPRIGEGCALHLEDRVDLVRADDALDDVRGNHVYGVCLTRPYQSKSRSFV